MAGGEVVHRTERRTPFFNCLVWNGRKKQAEEGFRPAMLGDKEFDQLHDGMARRNTQRVAFYQRLIVADGGGWIIEGWIRVPGVAGEGEWPYPWGGPQRPGRRVAGRGYARPSRGVLAGSRPPGGLVWRRVSAQPTGCSAQRLPSRLQCPVALGG